MRDLNYFPLNVESNIYGMTTLEFDDRTSKILVATLDCQIYCINYNKFKPQTREIEFTYIPNGARIISIGALKRGINDFAIGITHSLASNVQKSLARSSSSLSGRETGDCGKPTTYYLNIYASGSLSSSFDLDYVAQGCQTIRLRYVPYHLYQTQLVSYSDQERHSTRSKPVWLLSGGDNSIHAFCEDQPYQSFDEIPIEDCFPELKNIPGLALWLDVYNLYDEHTGHERAIAIGFEDGSVRLYHGILSRSTSKFELRRESSFDAYTTVIPSVRLFKVRSTYPSKVRGALNQKNLLKKRTGESLDDLNLLVVSSTNPSLVFANVLKMGLDFKFELPESQRIDCAVASAVGDTNFDGLNELLIGTHGRELLTYQYDKFANTYHLGQAHELNHPIFAISILDLTGDALKEVTILLSSGILVMQAIVKDVLEICIRRIDTLLSIMTS